MCVTYGLKPSEIAAAQNLFKSWYRRNTTIKAINNPSNKDMLLVVGEFTYFGTSTKTGARIARPLILNQNIWDELRLKQPKLPVINSNSTRDKLIEDGHNVTDFYLKSDKDFNRDWKKTRQKVIADDVAKFLKAENISLKDADDILSSWSASHDDILKAEKSILINRIVPGVKDTQLWGEELLTKILYEEKQLISRLERRWHLQHIGKSSKIQQHYWAKKIKESKIYLPDWRSPHFVASKLLDIGLRKI
ncbi:hypothetical protein [Okeania sp. SIO2B3]|uniref:hypothetical protein n=1 Tax=Okeania sp. SIO2B3 TaxID=2607784 RepID=UPI0013BEE907|nr:hypothetical protein [Okeania sp. SIO2B3]NET46128.1 hypothetical protein [Okeania sp. SIO2B3]